MTYTEMGVKLIPSIICHQKQNKNNSKTNRPMIPETLMQTTHCHYFRGKGCITETWQSKRRYVIYVYSEGNYYVNMLHLKVIKIHIESLFSWDDSVSRHIYHGSKIVFSTFLLGQYGPPSLFSKFVFSI